jgi:hypothetical protein
MAGGGITSTLSTKPVNAAMTVVPVYNSSSRTMPSPRAHKKSLNTKVLKSSHDPNAKPQTTTREGVTTGS